MSKIEVVQDQQYSNTYRVRKADGSLTDMVNYTRAHDAMLVIKEGMRLSKIPRTRRKQGQGEQK